MLARLLSGFNFVRYFNKTMSVIEDNVQRIDKNATIIQLKCVLTVQFEFKVGMRPLKDKIPPSFLAWHKDKPLRPIFDGHL